MIRKPGPSGERLPFANGQTKYEDEPCLTFGYKYGEDLFVQ